MDHLPYNIRIGDPVLVEIERGARMTTYYTGLISSIGYQRKLFAIIGVHQDDGQAFGKSFDIPAIQAVGDEIEVIPYTLN